MFHSCGPSHVMSLFSRYTFPNLRHPACGMATLKEIAVRLRSVKNIQKITASMKMVATSKFSRAERDLRAARPYGNSAKAFYEAAELTAVEDELKPNTVIVAIASDRGLCGAANSTIVKAVRALLKSAPEAATSAKLVLVGDKARSQLSRTYRDLFWLSFSDVGKKTPTFGDAATVAEEMAHSGVKFDQVIMFYNTFKSVISYNLTTQPIHDADGIRKSPKYPLYDSVDGEVLRSFSEYLFVALIYAAMKEAAASEQSARMTAMDAATKNAGDMIDRLTLTFNRTRQAVITRELTEIISGAAAV